MTNYMKYFLNKNLFNLFTIDEYYLVNYLSSKIKFFFCSQAIFFICEFIIEFI